MSDPDKMHKSMVGELFIVFLVYLYFFFKYPKKYGTCFLSQTIYWSLSLMYSQRWSPWPSTEPGREQTSRPTKSARDRPSRRWNPSWRRKDRSKRKTSSRFFNTGNNIALIIIPLTTYSHQRQVIKTLNSQIDFWCISPIIRLLLARLCLLRLPSKQQLLGYISQSTFCMSSVTRKEKSH